MVHPLKPAEYAKVKSLFETMNHNLAPQALVAGTDSGTIYVDDPAAPQSAVARVGRRFYFVGDAENEAFADGLRALLLDEVYPQAQEAGEVGFVFYYAPGDWEGAIERILAGKPLERAGRQYWTFRGLPGDWRGEIPRGYTVRPIDRALTRSQYKNLDLLTAEMASETPSVGYFLRHRFGYCLTSQYEVVGWCLSEHNCGKRCEVGIETLQEYRQQGVATATGSALVDYALSREIEVGWHCDASNTPSIATARKLGFEKVLDYPAFYALLDG
jgi:RimJ/RimL family protein N-acetyltransferase